MEDAEAIWAAKADEELLEAAATLADFTEEGERILRAELRRRGLPNPPPSIGRCARCGRSIFAGDVRETCAQCGEPFPPDIVRELGAQSDVALVAVLSTGDPGVMAFARSLLDGEGIDYTVRGENLQDLFGMGRLGGYNYVTGPADILVRADDAERARALLDKGSPSVSEPAVDPNDA